MILKANQYKNCKSIKVDDSLVRSVNTTLVQTTPYQITELTSYDYSFDTPDSVEYFYNYKMFDRYITAQRTESQFFEIDETYTSTVPFNFWRYEVICTMQHRKLLSVSSLAAGIDQVRQDEKSLIKSRYFPKEENSDINTWDDFINSLDPIQISTNDSSLPKVGRAAYYIGNQAIFELDIPDKSIPITVTQVDAYTLKIKGKLPYYSMYLDLTDYLLAEDVNSGYFEDWFASSIQLKLYAGTVLTEEIDYSSSEELPAYELSSSELLQADAKAIVDLEFNIVKTEIIQYPTERFIRVYTKKAIASNLYLELTMSDGSITKSFNSGEIINWEIPISFESFEKSLSIEPKADNIYLYDINYSGDKYATAIASITQNILKAFSTVKTIIELDLLDESLEIKMNDEFQLKDKFDQLRFEGRVFRVYSIDYKINSTTIRKIKALEV